MQITMRFTTSVTRTYSFLVVLVWMHTKQGVLARCPQSVANWTIDTCARHQCNNTLCQAVFQNYQMGKRGNWLNSYDSQTTHTKRSDDMAFNNNYSSINLARLFALFAERKMPAQRSSYDPIYKRLQMEADMNRLDFTEEDLEDLYLFGK